jgi:hypothetical protein
MSICPPTQWLCPCHCSCTVAPVARARGGGTGAVVQQVHQTARAPAAWVCPVRRTASRKTQGKQANGVAEQQRQGARIAPGVGDDVPVAREARQALHRGEVDHVGCEDVVRRIGIEAQGSGLGVARDRRAAQALEDAELDLVRCQRHQAVEAGGETSRHPRPAGRRSGPRAVCAVAVLAQPAQVVFGHARSSAGAKCAPAPPGRRSGCRSRTAACPAGTARCVAFNRSGK